MWYFQYILMLILLYTPLLTIIVIITLTHMHNIDIMLIIHVIIFV